MEIKEILVAKPTQVVSMLDYINAGNKLEVGLQVCYRLGHFSEEDSWIFYSNEVPMVATELTQIMIDTITAQGESYIRHHNFHIILDSQETNYSIETYNKTTGKYCLKTQLISEMSLAEAMEDCKRYFTEDKSIEAMANLLGHMVIEEYKKNNK